MSVYRFPDRPDDRPMVTKKVLAAHLNRSARWLELRMAEGMPIGPLDAAGRRLFDLKACCEWLEGRSRKIDSGEHVPMSVRVESLESQVSELRGQIEHLMAEAARGAS